jgi:hypothetical protein
LFLNEIREKKAGEQIDATIYKNIKKEQLLNLNKLQIMEFPPAKIYLKDIQGLIKD